MKNFLPLLACTMSVFTSAAFADNSAFKAPNCPSISDVQSVSYLDTYPRLDGTFAAVGASNFGGSTPWAIVQLGLKRDNPWAANKKSHLIDTKASEVASREIELGLPVWGCVYSSSTDSNFKVVAVTAMDTLGLLTSPAASVNPALLASQVK